MSQLDPLFIDSTTVIQITDAVDEDGNTLSGLTVTLEAVRHKRTGLSVDGISTPASFSNDGSGAYSVSVDATSAELIEGDTYQLEVKAVGTNSAVRVWVLEREAGYDD